MPPFISVEIAITTVALALAYIYLGVVFMRHRSETSYPINPLGMLFISASIWLLSNVYMDRTGVPEIRLYVGRLSFIAAYFVVLFFVLFCLRFPPETTKSKAKKIIILSIAVVIAGAAYSLSPSGIFSAIDNSTDGFSTGAPIWANVLLHLSYVGLVIAGALVLLKKNKTATHNNIKAIRIVILGLALNVPVIAFFSVLSIANVGSYYYQYFGYLSSCIFFSFVVYSVNRFGPMSRSFSYSLKAILVLLISTVIALLWLN